MHKKEIVVTKVSNPQKQEAKYHIKDVKYASIYRGRIMYRPEKLPRLLNPDVDVIEEILYDDVTLDEILKSNKTREDEAKVTKAIRRRAFEIAAFGKPERTVRKKIIIIRRCTLTEKPYFIVLILKISLLDLLLTLLFFIIVIYHRASIIPARRRYKIRMGILKHRKRKMKDRARRRLRKLNVLRKRRKGAEAEETTETPGGAKKKLAKKSSSSSSELVTAYGDVAKGAEVPPPAGATKPTDPSKPTDAPKPAGT